MPEKFPRFERIWWKNERIGNEIEWIGQIWW